jgi:hypothetical protein
MRKIFIVAVATLMCGSSFAQTGTGPTPQTDTMNKPGMSSPMNSNAKMMKHKKMKKNMSGSGSMPMNDGQKSSMGGGMNKDNGMMGNGMKSDKKM